MADAMGPSEPERLARLDRLTARQRQVLDVIRAYQDEHRCSPTIREIGDRLGIKSPNGVLCHLRCLERAGMIRRDRHYHRRITLLD